MQVGGALISLLLLGVSGALIDSHLRQWRAVVARHASEATETRFFRRRHRRRLTASTLIGVAGAMIAVWPLVPTTPLAVIAYLALLSAAASVILALGLFDAAASAKYYGARNRKEAAAAIDQLKRHADEVRKQRTDSDD
ncbi:hypothetical protein Mal64_25380 [Pseudobythopirellula maris]|uniref:Uncharacterized protein n=1 Tax=Pseudobythopirellula maris TaxID=2527991 RepID=A0A5C5ZPE7_9BACT|nr:hypothetical protein [Pseudobythopirellula maris]TWT89046.1 hypothetical protein Mal64_25380 [Pseudobythopirellula maris]